MSHVNANTVSENDSPRAIEFWGDHNGPIIQFNLEWKNSTGYLDGLVDDMSIWDNMIGQLCRTVDDYGRRVLIAKTQFGNVVVFERHVQHLDKPQVIWTCNVPREIEASRIIGTGAVSEQSFGIFFKSYETETPTGYQKLIYSIFNAIV